MIKRVEGNTGYSSLEKQK